MSRPRLSGKVAAPAVGRGKSEQKSKRVSYNSNFYSELSGNDKENGELIYYDTAWYEDFPLSIKKGEFEYKVLKLGQTQKFNFEVNSIREAV